MDVIEKFIPMQKISQTTFLLMTLIITYLYLACSNVIHLKHIFLIDHQASWLQLFSNILSYWCMTGQMC